MERIVMRTLPNSKDLGSYEQQNPRPLCFSMNGKVLLRDGNGIVCYDPKDKTMRNLEFWFISDCKMNIVIHFVSLVPLNFGTCVETIVGVEEEEPSDNKSG
ncbi:hypothetical protein IFM89_018704 [Coptis chinensis]|uniref:Uncharacterized protein n=1 Tax=Coptis chinensis TaxID=261450 RepID=A0A835HFJ0_9MAGN|nr:hypothetical protein IFM89_018704 [Coptis chinensis]